MQKLTEQNNKNKDDKVILLNSGGFDSTVLFYDLIRQEKKVLSLFFDYGQNNKRKEFSCVKRMCKKFGQEFKIIKLPLFDWSNSSVIKKQRGVADEKNEYLEMRNLVFLSYAVSVAESMGVTKIFMALVKCTYDLKDTSTAFIDIFNSLTTGACNIEVVTPFNTNTKSELGVISKTLGITKRSYFSCNFPQRGRPCGVCCKCTELSKLPHL